MLSRTETQRIVHVVVFVAVDSSVLREHNASGITYSQWVSGKLWDLRANLTAFHMVPLNLST